VLIARPLSASPGPVAAPRASRSNSAGDDPATTVSATVCKGLRRNAHLSRMTDVRTRGTTLRVRPTVPRRALDGGDVVAVLGGQHVGVDVHADLAGRVPKPLGEPAVLDDGTMRDRFIVCRNPDEADRDRIVREQIVERLEAATEGSDDLSERKRAELAGRLKTRPAYNRFLRVTPKTGLLRIDRAAITADAKLDGKFLLRTADPTLSAEDVALGYRQLLQVERGWRDLKLHLDLRPVFHRRQDRIRAHVLLCWLALLLTRIAEHATDDTWRNLRRELHQLAAIESQGPDGTIIETTRPTPNQQHIYNACKVAAPPRFLGIDPA